jgi:hypothetical protein
MPDNHGLPSIDRSTPFAFDHTSRWLAHHPSDCVLHFDVGTGD